MVINILSIDTATEQCSVALLIEDKILSRQQLSPREHSKLILNMVTELLQEANLKLSDIDVFAYGQGPGSFTGLRLAASVIQGLSFGVNKPVVPVSTLQALAQAVWQQFGWQQIVAVLDARMQELYYGFYRLDPEQQLMREITPDALAGPAIVTEQIQQQMAINSNWHVVGTGDLIKLECLLYPHAQEIAVIAQRLYAERGGVSVEEAVPIYIRDL